VVVPFYAAPFISVSTFHYALSGRTAVSSTSSQERTGDLLLIICAINSCFFWTVCQRYESKEPLCQGIFSTKFIFDELHKFSQKNINDPRQPPNNAH
jgi:hypothetical protein